MAEFTIDQINKRIAADPDMQELHKSYPKEFDSQVTQMYSGFGYNAEGLPFNRATKIAKSVEGVTGIPSDSLKNAASMGLEMAGASAGMTVGMPAGVPGITGGAMVGSLAGKKVADLLGLNDDSTPASDAISLVAPLVPNAIGKAIGGIGKAMRSIPGVGTTFHQQAAERLEGALAKATVTSADVDTFADALQHQIKTAPFRIKTPGLKQAVDDELSSAVASKVPDTVYIKQLRNLHAELSSDTSFRELMATEKAFNKLKISAPTDVWKRLSGVLVEDMDNAATNPAVSQKTRDKIAAGSQAFKNLVKVNRKFNASTSLQSLMKSAVTEVDGDPNMIRFNKTAFMKKLNTSAEFDTSKVGSTFDASEIQSIKNAVNDVGYLGWGPTGGTQSAGSYIGRSGAAGAIGFTIGGGSKGAMTGFAAAAALSKALESEAGRKLVSATARKGKGMLDMTELNRTLGQVIAGASAGIVPGVTGTGQQTGSGVQPFPVEQ